MPSKRTPKRLPHVQITCEECGKVFGVPPCVARENRRFCSRACYRAPWTLRRLLLKANFSNPLGCWEWTGLRDKNGYGKVGAAGETRRTHVIAWEITNGRKVRPGKLVMHSCDNPPCFCPLHVLEGTNAQNTADKVAKGRSATGDANGSRLHPEKLVRGAHHPVSKLNPETVKGILEKSRDGQTQLSLAADYGVSKATISNVVLGKHWTSRISRE